MGGILAISPSEGRRKLFMHINVTIGLAGPDRRDRLKRVQRLWARAVAGVSPDYIALAAKLTMAVLLLIYVNLCVRSFIQARRSRKE